MNDPGNHNRKILKVGIGSLGTIGVQVAKALDAGISGLELCAVSARNLEKAAGNVAGFRHKPDIVPLSELAELADVVLECAPAAVYDEIAYPAVRRGRIFVTMTSSALLNRLDLIDEAKETGARLIVPTGGCLGFDAIKAAAEGEIQSVKLVTRKPPKSLEGAPYLEENRLSLSNLTAPLKVFEGSAREAARAFPANVNVAASLSLAGIGPDRTTVEIWADPGIDRAIQELIVRSEAADMDMRIASHPLRTGSLTPKSAIATLRALVSNFRVGT